MTVTARQPDRRSWSDVGLLLVAILVLAAQLACISHALVIDAPRDAGAVLPAEVRAQHAAEQWSAAPCTCDAGHTTAPTHAEPLMPAITLIASAIIITAVWHRSGMLLPKVHRLCGCALQPVTPPPQA